MLRWAARDSALAAALALLIGLIGSVIGGWFGSGEPMDWATAMRQGIGSTKEGGLIVILVWPLGVPLGLMLVLFLFGIGR